MPKMIGYIPTDPVSIPTSAPRPESIFLSVSTVNDSIELSAPDQVTYRLKDVRHTAVAALSKAFDSTFTYVNIEALVPHTYELRLLRLSVNYQPTGYYTHTEYSASRLSSGPKFNSSTTTINPFSIDTECKAVLYRSDSLVATFGTVVNSPGIWDMEANLKKAMERMAEYLNTDVVQFLLSQKQE